MEGPEPRPAHDRKQDANELRLERIEALLKRLVGAQEQMAQAQQAFELDNTISASFWDNSVSKSKRSVTFRILNNSLQNRSLSTQPVKLSPLLAS